MSTFQSSPSPLFTRLVYVAFGLMAVVLMLSAYLRLSGAGFGCADWPACYGQGYADPAITKQAAGQWGAALLALGLTLFLSVLGIWTPGTRLPAVVLGNLLGGMALLAVLWWLSLSSRRYGATVADARFRTVVWFGLILLFVQIGLGGLVSANFAASACTRFPACGTGWFEAWSWAAFNPWRELVVQSNGAVTIPFDAAAIHVTHRATAVAVDFYLLLFGLTAIGSAASRYGKALVGLIFLQALLGITAVKFAHPVAVVLAHNALAAVLLLTLLSLAYRPHDHA